MKTKFLHRFTHLFLVAILFISTITFAPSSHAESNNDERKKPTFTNVSVHDPSIIKEGDTYYVFGSHIEAAKSNDLMNWETFTNGYTSKGNVLYGDLSENLAESFKWAGEDDADSKGGYSVWAPEILWNDSYVNEDGTTGAYIIYYSVSSTYMRSAIGYAVSQNIEGPYEYVDTIIYSGFTEHEDYDENSDVNKQWENTNIKQLIDEGILEGPKDEWFHANGGYNNTTYPNAIDANLFYDEEGKLWMTYGSWSGGIFMLEIDPETGRAIYPGEDGVTEDGRMIDRYFGIHIAGGYWKSGEGPYVVYDEETGYYYLYVTYGFLDATGGYNMRQFRATEPEGPYLDAAGKNAVLPNDTDNAPYGNKLMSNFLFARELGEPGMGSGLGYVSPGHNSVYLDPDTNEQFLVFHTRFPDTGEMHQVRIHQMFMNKNDWPVVAPYRYAGETLDENIDDTEIVGEYKFINHKKDNSPVLNKSQLIRLNEDKTISGAVEGTWSNDGYYAEITINNETYHGVFVENWNPTAKSFVITFTALSDKGVSIWGSKNTLSDRTEEDIVKAVLDDIKLGNINEVIQDLVLPTEGTYMTEITWETSDPDVVTDKGKITRPEAGAEPVTAVLTATATSGSASATKEFNITVLPLQETGLVAHYQFDEDLSEADGRFADGTVVGKLIGESGGNITYAEGINGSAAVFDGQSGISLPDGLITSHSYSVSLWLKPEELTQHTTTFFGARDEHNWVSLVPYGPGNGDTMVWSGSSEWYDGDTGMQIEPGEWYHLAFTVDEGDLTVYVNGEKKFSDSNFPHIFTTTNTYFALGVNHWDPPYQGLLDELRIYEGVLSEEEIKNHYEAMLSGETMPASPEDADDQMNMWLVIVGTLIILLVVVGIVVIRKKKK